MKLLWVKSDKIGSRIIRLATRNKASHFAMVFDEDSIGQGIVFHSHRQGTELAWFGNFLKEYTIVNCLKLKQPISVEQEEQIWKSVVKDLCTDGYDYLALFWEGLSVFVSKIGFKTPTNNQWQDKKKSLCTNVAKALVESMPQYFKQFSNIDYEMILPDDLYMTLATSQYLTPDDEWREQINSYRQK